MKNFVVKNSKIWAFGDSFTFGHGCRPDGPLSEYYENYKNEEDKLWVEWLGEFLNMKTENLGFCGASNDYIIDSIIDNWKYFEENDYVIVGITWSSRFDVPINERLITVYWDWKNSYKNENLSNEKLETIINFQYYFSDDNLYKERHNKRFNFIEKLLREKKIKSFFWDVNRFSNSDNFETIRKSTNKKIDDQHFSFAGHKQFAEYILKVVTGTKNIV